jgi:hypothetical protein
VGGFPVAAAVPGQPSRLAAYVATEQWPVRRLLGLVDDLVGGGLLARTPGVESTAASDPVATIRACR